MTLTEFYDQLEKFDWYYANSDDHSVWRRGETRWQEIVQTAKDNGPEFLNLLHEYGKHMYSGKTWDTEQAPKPARPRKDRPTHPQNNRPSAVDVDVRLHTKYGLEMYKGHKFGKPIK